MGREASVEGMVMMSSRLDGDEERLAGTKGACLSLERNLRFKVDLQITTSQ